MSACEEEFSPDKPNFSSRNLSVEEKIAINWGRQKRAGGDASAAFACPSSFTLAVGEFVAWRMITVPTLVIICYALVIPTNRRLKLNLPESFPCGEARLSITMDTAPDGAGQRPAFDTRSSRSAPPALAGVHYPLCRSAPPALAGVRHPL
jgi:hypothetical protein